MLIFVQAISVQVAKDVNLARGLKWGDKQRPFKAPYTPVAKDVNLARGLKSAMKRILT